MLNKKVKIKNKLFEYALKKRKGARSVRLSIHADGACVVTAPKWYPMYLINNFIREKSDWILEKIKNIDFSGMAERKRAGTAQYKAEKESARGIIQARVDFFSNQYGFEYNRIAIKNQKSCWGSCSRKKNLNFNYKVANLPTELRDYVIVHELCHLKELNHSHKFWQLVRSINPNYNRLRSELRCLRSKA